MTDNPARAAYDLASTERRLGSKITRKQREAVLMTESRPEVELDSLAEYAWSGDHAVLSDAESISLKAFVAECKEHPVLETDSQKRRLWPRKVAAILAFE